eukprot:jgi/Botrbrau1/10785/Bobra.0119s0011.1
MPCSSLHICLSFVPHVWLLRDILHISLMTRGSSSTTTILTLLVWKCRCTPVSDIPFSRKACCSFA